MASLKPKSFTTVYDFEDDVLGDDYSDACFETWKFKAKTSKNSTFDFEAKFDHKFDKDNYL